VLLKAHYKHGDKPYSQFEYYWTGKDSKACFLLRVSADKSVIPGPVFLCVLMSLQMVSEFKVALAALSICECWLFLKGITNKEDNIYYEMSERDGCV
jgi:hypothetical protein